MSINTLFSNNDYDLKCGKLTCVSINSNCINTCSNEGLGSQIFDRIDNSNNGVTLSCSNGYTINGSSSISLNNDQYCEIIFNNNNWICSKFNKV